jgi:hypothetical protein
MDTKMPRAKLTIAIWDRLFSLLEERTETCHQRRDSLLEHVIALEIDHLRDDLPQANSGPARSHIEHHLKLLLTDAKKQMSLSLSPETALKLEAVCREKNVPRESFLNRIILLLVAKPAFLDDALFGLDPQDAHGIRVKIKNEFSLNLELENGFAPLPMISSILIDPFWGYRAMTEVLSNDGDEDYTLYGMAFRDRSLIGLNCYLPDSEIPGTQEYLATQTRLGQILAELGSKRDAGRDPPKDSDNSNGE